MTPRAALLVALLSVVIAVVAAACDGDAGDAGGLVLSLQAADGGPLGEYVAVLSGDAAGDAAAAPLVLECSAASPAEVVGATCDGARLRPDPERITHVVIKARGYEHLSLALDAAAAAPKTLRPTPLGPPEVSEDYATGVANADAFEALAIPFTTELGPAQVVKFYVRDLGGREGGPTVYFQNTARHPLHYPFYRDVLGLPATRAEFEAATYYSEDRQAAAGTLVWYPTLKAPVEAPLALTFFPSDDLSPALALRVQQLIEARLPFLAPVGRARRLVYLPAGVAHEEAVAAVAAEWARADAPWVRQRDLYGALREQLLNEGVAFGTLRRMTPEQLDGAVVSYRDILILTRLPNDLPLVGGTITEELQTPLAHVNVAARGRGTPNLALLDASDHPEIAPLLGQLVRFEVAAGAWTLRAATLAEAEAFWASRVPEPLTPAADVTTEGLLDFEDIGFSDARTVGVKAANLAELHGLLGEQAPAGFAVPFYYYDRFLATTVVPPALCVDAREDCVQEGRPAEVCAAAQALCTPPATGSPETLAQLITRLLADADVGADSALREAALDGLRWLMRHLPVDPAFGAALDAEVAARFGTARVRLRSSTNSEDLPNFSGAGLYTSVGADTAGGDEPSDEIRKVWASAWNWRAFEERAFWGIDHAAVRVGVAVHAAFPDERVNGVLITRNLADPTVAGYYVNLQRGQVSVTNPSSGAVPEILTLTAGPAGLVVLRQRLSSLSPDAPLLDDASLTRLYLLAVKVQRHFEGLYDRPEGQLTLDMELKLTADGRLIIKQVRPFAGR